MQRNSSLGFIFVTILIDVLGIGLLIPVLPDLVAHLSHQSLSGSAADYGRLIAIYGAMQFLFAPMLGTLSDRYGRRPILLLSLLFAGLDYILMAIAPTMAWLYIGRTLSGITGANMTAANAYIADVSPPEKRSINFGVVSSAVSVGLIVGPALGGYLGQLHVRLPFIAAAVLCFGNLLYGYFILPESLRRENRKQFDARRLNPIGALAILIKYPIVWGLTGALIASNLGMQCVNSTWVLYTELRFGWTPGNTGLSLSVLGITALFYQFGVARVVLPRWGDKRVLLIGLAIGAIEFTAYGLATRGWMIYAIIVLGGLALLGSQATQGLLSRQVADNEQGTLQGALSGLASLAAVVAPLLATPLFAYFTGPRAPAQIPGISMFAGGALYLMAFFMALLVLSKFRATAIAAA